MERSQAPMILVKSRFISNEHCCRFCSSEEGDILSYDPLPSQRSCSYKVRLEDIGRRLKCECVVTDLFGRSTDPVYVETTPVLPGNCFDSVGLVDSELYPILIYYAEVYKLVKVGLLPSVQYEKPH